MKQAQLINFSSLRLKDVAIAGGKAASLGELTQMGINVPRGFVISTNIYRSYNRTQIPTLIRQKILARFDDLKTDRVSIRSSAIAEDSSSGSWAGQFKSFLNVTRDEVINKVYECWMSVEDGKIYANLQNSKAIDLSMAVIVQKMVDSEVSGVAFSRNPVSPEDDSIMIEATYGLGEMLVQGLITPDNYLVNRMSFKITAKDISPKKLQLSFKDNTTKEVAVNENKINTQCLDDVKIVELAKLAIQIESHYRIPQDIEWALERGKLYILQSRPITT